jgi:hypothetical protein
MWRAAVIVVAVIGLPFMGKWGIAALLLLAFALVLDLQERLECAERLLGNTAEQPGHGLQSPEVPQEQRLQHGRRDGPWRDK